MGEDQNEWYIKCKTGRICLGRYSDWFYDIYIYIQETDHPSNNFDNNLVHHAKVWWQRATLADIRMSGPCWSLHVIRLRGRLSSMWHFYGGPARCWNWQTSRYAFVIIYLPYIYIYVEMSINDQGSHVSHIAISVIFKCGWNWLPLTAWCRMKMIPVYIFKTRNWLKKTIKRTWTQTTCKFNASCECDNVFIRICHPPAIKHALLENVHG